MLGTCLLSWVHVMVMALHKENYRFNKLSRWIEARPATVIVEQPFLGVLRIHRWRGCMYPPVEGLYVPVWGEAVLYPAEEAWDRKRMCFMCITLKLVKIYIRYRRSISHHIVRAYRVWLYFFFISFLGICLGITRALRKTYINTKTYIY